jgi:Holliday junction resolvasome RuvABC endonuclease subunit
VGRVRAVEKEIQVARKVAGGDVFILGIDPGLSCGWCVLKRTSKGKVLYEKSGIWNLSSGRFSSRGMTLVRLEEHLLPVIHSLKKEGSLVVVYELSRFFHSVDSCQSHGAIVGHIQYLCETRGLMFEGLAPSTVKKRMAGKGNADKKLVRKAVVAIFGEGKKKFGKKDDETDAVAIAYSFAVGKSAK